MPKRRWKRNYYGGYNGYNGYNGYHQEPQHGYYPDYDQRHHGYQFNDPGHYHHQRVWQNFNNESNISTYDAYEEFSSDQLLHNTHEFFMQSNFSGCQVARSPSQQQPKNVQPRKKKKQRKPQSTTPPARPHVPQHAQLFQFKGESKKKAVEAAKRNATNTTFWQFTIDNSRLRRFQDDRRTCNFDYGNQEAFEGVRQLWCSKVMPNPHANLARRYRADGKGTSKRSIKPQSDDDLYHVHFFFDKKIALINYELKNIGLQSVASQNPDNPMSSEDWLRKVKKNEAKLNHARMNLEGQLLCLHRAKEEVEKIYDMYPGVNGGHGALFLTKDQTDEVLNQDCVMEGYKTFYV